MTFAHCSTSVIFHFLNMAIRLSISTMQNHSIIPVATLTQAHDILDHAQAGINHREDTTKSADLETSFTGLAQNYAESRIRSTSTISKPVKVLESFLLAHSG